MVAAFRGKPPPALPLMAGCRLASLETAGCGRRGAGSSGLGCRERQQPALAWSSRPSRAEDPAPGSRRQAVWFSGLNWRAMAGPHAESSGGTWASREFGCGFQALITPTVPCRACTHMTTTQRGGGPAVGRRSTPFSTSSAQDWVVRPGRPSRLFRDRTSP